MKIPVTFLKSSLILAIILSATPAMAQTAYTWSSGSTWSTATWTPTGTPATATDTATIALSNATGTQILSYDAGATGLLGTLTITETGAGANEVALVRSLTLSNALTLASSTGQSEIFVNGSGSLIDAAGIAVNSGGVLDVNNSTALVRAAGGLTVATGGTLTAGSGALIVTGLDLEGATGGLNFSTYNSSSSGFQLSGTNTINSSSSGVSIKNLVILNGSTLSSNLQVSGLFVAGTSSGKVNNLSSSYSGSGAQIAGNLSFNQSTLSSNTFQLGSNLTISGILASNTTNHPSSGAGNITFGIDLNGHTFDFTTGGTTTQVFAPVNGDNPQGSTTWTIGDTSAGGNGTIEADHFTLSGVLLENTKQGVVNVTNNITLQATGGSGTANDLGNSLAGGGATGGTIASTTTFLYSGLASTANAATLTSNRSIGNLTVQNGALETTGGTVAVGGAAVTVNSGGTLILGTGSNLGSSSPTLSVSGAGTFDLNGNAQTIGAVTLGDLTGGGTIQNSSATAATLTGTNVTFNPGSTLSFNLSTSGNTSGLTLALSGAFTKGTTGTGAYDIDLTGGSTTPGTTYDLVNFGSTTFSATDFTEIGSLAGSFQINSGQLDFVTAAVPEPSTWALLVTGVALLAGCKFGRRRLGFASI